MAITSVQDKVFVVTGGGNGIGREVVLLLLERGARVAAVDLRPEALATTAELAHADDRLSLHELDITDRAGVAALPQAVLAAHGHVDGVLNVAGMIQPFVPIADLDLAVVEKVMDVNFWGTVTMVKAFLPHLLDRPAAAVVDVSSMGGFLPVPGQSAYGASKAAVKLFTEGLYAELRGTPVSVTVVFPGGVATDITANSGVRMERSSDGAQTKGMTLTTPRSAAEQIVRGMERGAYRVVIGKDATAMDRLARLSPQRATDLIARKMASLLDVPGR